MHIARAIIVAAHLTKLITAEMHQKMPAVNAGTMRPRYHHHQGVLKKDQKHAVTNAIAPREHSLQGQNKPQRHPVHILVVL
jgi:hypothetical protein